MSPAVPKASLVGVLCALAGIVLTAGRASAITGDSDGAFGLDGSLRTTALSLSHFEHPLLFGPGNKTGGQSTTVLRLVGAGHPSERVAYEVHLVQGFDSSSTSGASSGTGAVAPVSESRLRALDLTADWAGDADSSASLLIDRASVTATPLDGGDDGTGALDITLGRQAITFGETLFWSPMDVFFPFDPRQFDREYKAGVDALRADLALGPFSGITAVGAAGRKLRPDGRLNRGKKPYDASWYGSAAVLRAYTSTLDLLDVEDDGGAAGWSLSAQGGKVYGGYHGGVGAVGEVLGVGVRAELTRLWAVKSDPLPAPLSGDVFRDATSLVVGAEYRFENTLWVRGEYFYNGAGSPGDLLAGFARVGAGVTFNASRHILGISVAYELSPLINGSAAVLYSASDRSFQVQPGIVWSAADEVEIIAGGIISAGNRPGGASTGTLVLESEFGTSPNAAYVQFKVYF